MFMLHKYHYFIWILVFFNYFTIVFIIIVQIQYMFTTSQVLDRPVNFTVQPGGLAMGSCLCKKTLHETEQSCIHIKPNLISSQHTQCQHSTNNRYIFLVYKERGKAVLVCAMWTYRVHKSTVSLILNLNTRNRGMANLTDSLLHPQLKSPWYPSNRRLGGPQSWSAHFSKGKICCRYRESNPTSSCP